MPATTIEATPRQLNAIEAINAARRHHTGHGFLEGASLEHSGEWFYVQIAEGSEYDRVYPIRTYRVSRDARTIEVLSIGGFKDARELLEIPS